MKLSRSSRWLFVLVFVVASTAQSAAPDEVFATFFERFVHDQHFRISRVHLPLKATIGSACEKSEENFRWNRPQFEEDFTVPLTQDQLHNEGLSEKVTAPSPNEVVVFQYRDEGDSYLITYTFRRIGGRWLLVHFEDASC